MKKLFAISLAFLSSSVWAMGGDDPLLYKVSVDKLEARKASHGYPVVFDGDAWLGKDYNKLWLKSEVEYAESEIEEAEIQLLYSRAMSAFWDVQIGWRRDLKPAPAQDWLAISLKGLAPYMFESDISLFVDTDGRVNFRLDTEYELMLTQRLELSPELEMNAFSKAGNETGRGLSDVNLGLRLSYEVWRELAPYVGVNWSLKFGDTAQHARDHGDSDNDIQLLAGARIWF